jgi:hypothetical protein
MKVYKYKDINSLNQALFSFSKNSLDVVDVKIVGGGENIEFYVLTNSQINVSREPKPKRVVKKVKSAQLESNNQEESTEVVKN